MTTSYFLIYLSLSVAAQMMYNYYVYNRNLKKRRKEVNEVIMFSYGSIVLKKSKYSKCPITPSIDRLLHYLNSSRRTLDICMYVLTNVDVANVILKLHYRGVKVRLIIDTDMAFASGSQVRRLEKQGIPFRWMKSTNLMHHKFCLIDTESCEDPKLLPMVMMGSLNWTNQALHGNWEDVTVTSQSDIVEQFKIEFDRLWLLFRPIVEYKK